MWSRCRGYGDLRRTSVNYPKQGLDHIPRGTQQRICNPIDMAAKGSKTDLTAGTHGHNLAQRHHAATETRNYRSTHDSIHCPTIA
jgi:hypothetical protein